MSEIQTLTELRKKSGRTMSETAETLGVTKQAYWRKEKGLRRLQIDEAKVLASLFGVNVEDVIFSARKVTESVKVDLATEPERV